MVIGKRNRETTEQVVADFADRTGNVPPELITTDDCNTYADVLMEQYGETVVPERTGKPGRPRSPFKQWPQGSVYATVNKTYAKGRVAAVDRTVVHGTEDDLGRILEESSASDKINTSFVERQNGTDRTYNARKARKTYEFSKDIVVHLAVSWWVMLCYNFHFAHRGLQQRQADGTVVHRTPAVAAGLQEHPLTVEEILTTQIVGFSPVQPAVPADFGYLQTSSPAP